MLRDKALNVVLGVRLAAPVTLFVEVSEWVRVPEPETSPVTVAVLQGV